jgi:hypothetical protein
VWSARNEESEVAVYRAAWTNLTTRALDEDASREVITQALEEFSG